MDRAVVSLSAAVFCLLVASSALAAPFWGAVWKDPFGAGNEFTAQCFNTGGQRSLVIGNNYDTTSLTQITIVGTTLYGIRDYSIHQWDAMTGREIGPLTLSPRLEDQIESEAFIIGHTLDDELVACPFGSASSQRTCAMYDTTGAWIRNYTHPKMQHNQGQPAGNSDVMFFTMRYFPPGTQTAIERVLVFAKSGTYIGEFGSNMSDDIGDIAIMGNELFAIGYTHSDIYVFSMSGSSIPTFSRTIPLPANVNPGSWGADQITANGTTNSLYLGDTNDGAWYEVDLNGTLRQTFTASVVANAAFQNPLGPLHRVGANNAPPPPMDAGVPDSGEPDDAAAADDAGPEDSGALADSGPADTGTSDAGVDIDRPQVDSGSGPVDTGISQSTIDTGTPGSEVPDVNTLPDTGCGCGVVAKQRRPSPTPKFWLAGLLFVGWLARRRVTR